MRESDDVNTNHTEEEKEKENEKDQQEKQNEKEEQTKQDVLYAEEALKNYPRLFATRLPFKATEEDLENHFSKYGKIVDVYVSKKVIGIGNKGFGFVSFETQEAMEKALQEKLHVILGKEIVVDVASVRESKSDRFFLLPSNHYLFRGPRKKFFFRNKTIRNLDNGGYWGGYRGGVANTFGFDAERFQSLAFTNANIGNNGTTVVNVSTTTTTTTTADNTTATTNTNNNTNNNNTTTTNNNNNNNYIGDVSFDGIPNNMFITQSENIDDNTKANTTYPFSKNKAPPAVYEFSSALKYSMPINYPNACYQSYHQEYMSKYGPNYFLYCNNSSYDAYRNYSSNVYGANYNLVEEKYGMKNIPYPPYCDLNYMNRETIPMMKYAPYNKDGVPLESSFHRGVRKLPGGDEWNKRGYKLFVTKLNSITTTETLRHYFENFGEVIDVYMPNDPCTHRPRGIAFVTFLDSECVKNILSNSSIKHIIDGKEVVIDLADPDSRRKRYSGNF